MDTDGDPPVLSRKRPQTKHQLKRDTRLTRGNAGQLTSWTERRCIQTLFCSTDCKLGTYQKPSSSSKTLGASFFPTSTDFIQKEILNIYRKAKKLLIDVSGRRGGSVDMFSEILSLFESFHTLRRVLRGVSVLAHLYMSLINKKDQTTNTHTHTLDSCTENKSQ